MFFVFNKQKIYSYLVAASTVVILFILSFFFTNNNIDIMQTTSGVSKLIPVYSVDTTKKQISLSINLEDNAEDIDKILKALDKCNVKTTFFATGEWAEQHSKELKKIVEKGHEVANHSDKHIHMQDLSYEQSTQEILNCSKKIQKIIQKEVKIYRAPFGEYNDIVLNSAIDNGYIPVEYSIDTLDYEGLDASQMWDIIAKDLKAGAIILFHNGTENTANSLEEIIKNIQKRGYNIVKLSDLIYKENYEITPEGVQTLKKMTNE